MNHRFEAGVLLEHIRLDPAFAEYLSILEE